MGLAHGASHLDRAIFRGFVAQETSNERVNLYSLTQFPRHYIKINKLVKRVLVLYMYRVFQMCIIGPK